jgi:hypothetical protein
MHDTLLLAVVPCPAAAHLHHQLTHYSGTFNRGAFPKRMSSTPDGRVLFFPRGNDILVSGSGSGWAAMVPRDCAWHFPGTKSLLGVPCWAGDWSWRCTTRLLQVPPVMLQNRFRVCNASSCGHIAEVQTPRCTMTPSFGQACRHLYSLCCSAHSLPALAGGCLLSRQLACCCTK